MVNMPSKRSAEVFPRIQISGNSYECGKSYGIQAREQILLSLENYRKVFLFYAKWEWAEVLTYASEFVKPITDFDQELISELQGIADGAQVDFLDILAINTRTEIMFAAKARDKSLELPGILECSSFSVTSNPQGILIGENWDWLSHCKDTVIILEASPLNQPKYVTVVEAGLLAKFGMNSHGFGVATNALVSSFDKGNPGIPYHILLRSLLKMSNTIDAVILINKSYRSSSANYLLADKYGMSIDVEAMTGGWKEIDYLLSSSTDVLIHTNHFLSPRFTEFDISPGWIPSTLFRLQRLLRNVEMEKDVANPEFWKEILCSHLSMPHGVCTHDNLEAREEERFSTITSSVMNLSLKTLELTAGPPCSNEYVKIDYSNFLN